MNTNTSALQITLRSDGASRGNPGSASIGYVVFDNEGHILKSLGKPIGIKTNNQAEYLALIEGLKGALQIPFASIFIEIDSELIVKQIKGEYRVKDLSLKELFLQVDSLLSQAKGKWHIKHIRRAFNKEADQLCNLALDKNQEVSL